MKGEYKPLTILPTERRQKHKITMKVVKQRAWKKFIKVIKFSKGQFVKYLKLFRRKVSSLVGEGEIRTTKPAIVY